MGIIHYDAVVLYIVYSVAKLTFFSRSSGKSKTESS